MKLVYGLKMTALVVWALLTIITCSGVWNYNPESFIKWCAAALLVCNGIVVWRFGKRLSNEFHTEFKVYLESLKSNETNSK